MHIKGIYASVTASFKGTTYNNSGEGSLAASQRLPDAPVAI